MKLAGSSVLCAGLALACSADDLSATASVPEGGASTGGSPSTPVESDAGSQPSEPDAGTGYEDWELLVDGEWSMPPGEEGYVCVRTTLEEDTWVSAFHAISPPGTHHTLLSADPNEANEPDGIFPCNAGTNGPSMLFGSGLGTNDVYLPEGVAIRLPAGSAVLLNLHLFNTGTEPISGTSGTLIQTMSPEDMEYEAEQILAGKVAGLTVPPGVTRQTGECTMSRDVTIFAAAPHMHQLGSYLKATAIPEDGEPTVLIDAPYSFDEQVFYPVDPFVKLSAGDRIQVECEYTNDRAETVYFGDSTLAEMCFAGIYRYPKGDDLFICDDNFSFGR